jgi:hypothetical protein
MQIKLARRQRRGLGGFGTKCVTPWGKHARVPSTIGLAFSSGQSHGKSDALPLLVLAAAFVTLWLASLTGSWLRRRNPSAGDEQNEDIGVILAATLTLLALIIGFSFSMATNRYDQRKNFEEGEANAIGKLIKCQHPTNEGV